MWEREYRISWNGCTGTYLKIRLKKEGHLLEGGAFIGRSVFIEEGLINLV